PGDGAPPRGDARVARSVAEHRVANRRASYARGMNLAAARELNREHHRILRRRFAVVQNASRTHRTRQVSAKRYATLITHEREVWGAGLTRISDDFHSKLDIDAAIQYSYTEQRPGVVKRLLRAIRKADPNQPQDGTPNSQEARARLMAQINEASMLAGALQMYLGMAMQTDAAAGQISLEHLGINKTWAYAHPQNMANALYAVRGSKVIQNLYGDHVDRLTQIINEACDPRHPWTIQQVRQKIAAEWPQLQAYQVDRIARTETAAVWTATSMNAYAANGISGWTSSIATGPSIGIDSEDPCDECVEAAEMVHTMDDDIPPWHPNCRCEAIPELTDPETGDEWLPPDEPFNGGGPVTVEGTPAADEYGPQTQGPILS